MSAWKLVNQSDEWALLLNWLYCFRIDLQYSGDSLTNSR